MSSPFERLVDGQTFGRYRIVRMLGEGGMGAVYEAVHTGLKKRFAIKTLLPSIAKNAEAQARFLREGEAAARINHPNVVDVTDVGTESGIPYLVMEYLEGETLADLVARKGALGVELAIDLVVPILSAVSAGHDRGVIHRDLKPQNIFLSRAPWGEGIPKVLDFGVSKIIGGENPALTGTMSVLGTASYMSPEQARGAKVVDATTDQYALGLICYEMLTGARAHGGESPLEVLHKIATGTVPSTRDLRSDLPLELDAVLIRMLASKSDERYPSLRAVAKAILPFASERIRLSYQGSFDESPSPARLTQPMVLPAAQAGGTMILPDQGAAASAATPPPGSSGTPRVDTTLGQSAAEANKRSVDTRFGKGRVALTVAAVAVVAIVVVRFMGGTKQPPTPRPLSAKAVGSPESPAEGTPTSPQPAAGYIPQNLPPPTPPTVPTPPTPAEETKATVRGESGAEQHGTSHAHHVHRAPAENKPAPSTTPTKAGEPPRHSANNAPILD